LEFEGEKTAAKPADESIETVTRPITANDADRKFILALLVIVAFVVMLLIPIVTNNSTLFTTVATAMTGLVGTIIGYYFGSEKNQSTTPPQH
jgi:uncharacterized membrane protein